MRRAYGDATVLDHLEDDTGGLARVRLPHHALRHRARLERVVEAEAADVRVSADPLDARDVLDLLHFDLCVDDACV